jgi:hypothetical protein
MPRAADRIDLTYRDDVLTGVLSGRTLELPVELPVRATFAIDAIELSGTFLLLDPNNPVLLGATVAGSAGPDAVAASVSPDRKDTHSVVIDGHFGSVAVSIAATIAADLSNGIIVGTVDGEPSLRHRARRPTTARSVSGVRWTNRRASAS